MALLWADSFEHQTILRGYAEVGRIGNDGPVSFTTGRHGQGVQVGDYAGLGNGAAFLEAPISTSSDTLIMGYAWKGTTDDSPGSAASVETTTSYTVFTFEADTANGWRVANEGGALSSYGGTPPSLNKWYWVEGKIVVHASAGSVELRVNGVTVSSATGIDTTYTGTINIVRLGGGWEKSWNVLDDFVLMDGSGSSCNDFLGDTWVQAMAPNANGAVSQLIGSDADQTDNYDLVNETIPSTADYTGGSTNGSQDYYGMTDLGGGVTYYVHGAHFFGYLGKESGANAYGRMKVLDGVGTTHADDIHGLSTSYIYHNFPLSLTPSGSTWTPGRWADVQLGFEVRNATST